MSSANLKGVSSEARSTSATFCKSLNGSLSALREGAKQSNGIKKVPGVFTQNSHIDEAMSQLDTNGPIAEEWRRTKATQEANERDAARIVKSLGETALLLNVVWQKLLTPHGANNHPTEAMVA